MSGMRHHSWTGGLAQPRHVPVILRDIGGIFPLRHPGLYYEVGVLDLRWILGENSDMIGQNLDMIGKN